MLKEQLKKQQVLLKEATKKVKIEEIKRNKRAPMTADNEANMCLYLVTNFYV